MSTTQEFRLPNGLHVELRGSKLRDQKLFEDALRDGSLSRATTEILAACTVRVVDPGPWGRAVVDGALDWTKVSTGDRLAALIRLRQISWPEGHLLRADLACASCPAKQRVFGVNVDLRPEAEGGELAVFELPEESVARIRAGQPFETTVAGKRVTFGPALGEHEERMEALSEGDRDRYGTEVHTLALRVLSVEDVHPNDVLRWLADLDLGDADALDEAMDEQDGGIDLGFTATCPRGHQMLSVVPFDLEFWRPHRARRERRRQRPRAFAG